MMPAPPVTAPTTSALAPWLTRGARARAQNFDEPGDHSSCRGNEFTQSAHSPPYGECAGQVFSCKRSDLASPGSTKVITSLMHARDGGAAVAEHDGHGRGLGVRGAGLDEYDGPARLRAAGGHGRARNVQPYRTRVFFSDCVTQRNGSRLYAHLFMLG